MEELEISRYEDIIRRLAHERSDEIISNSDIAHAKVLLRYLLKYSKQKIRIFSTSLADKIYGDQLVLDEFEEFVAKKKGKVQIVLQSPEDLSFNSGIISLVGRYPKHFSLRTAVGKDRFFEPHFVVNDSNGYRFCPDKSKRSAIAVFNLKSTADNLIKEFKVLFNRSKPINVENIGLERVGEAKQKEAKVVETV